MITLYSDPLLLDFIKVCIQLPADEREQIEQFTGQKYDIDGAAIGNYSVAGPKWVARVDGEPIAVGGFVPQRPGVYRDFMMNTPAAFDRRHWFELTRICRRAMDGMIKTGAHRLECIAPAARSRVFRWYATLGYNQEAVLCKYCANGEDAVIFSRTS